MRFGLTPLRVEVAFWLTLWTGMALGIGLELDWGKKLSWPAREIGTDVATFTKPVLTEPFRLDGMDLFQEITARPLFVVTRRPAPAAPPPQEAKPGMQKDQFVLTGTTVVPEGKFAFLLEKSSGKSRVVKEGRDVNGIRVVEVAADRVVLKQYDDVEVLELKTIKPPPADVPAGATGSAGDRRRAGIARPLPPGSGVPGATEAPPPQPSGLAGRTPVGAGRRGPVPAWTGGPVRRTVPQPGTPTTEQRSDETAPPPVPGEQ